MGLFGFGKFSPFDFNGDGRLDVFEQAAEMDYIFNVFGDDDEDKGWDDDDDDEDEDDDDED